MAAMDKKRVAAQLEDVPEKRRFRAEALDLFLAGDISGQRTQRLVNSAKLAGAQHVDDLACQPQCIKGAIEESHEG